MITITHDVKSLAFDKASLVSSDTNLFVLKTTEKMEDTKRGALQLMHRMTAELTPAVLLELPKYNSKATDANGNRVNHLTDEYIVSVPGKDGPVEKSFWFWDDFVSATPAGKAELAKIEKLQEKMKDDKASNVIENNQVSRFNQRLTYMASMYGIAHGCFLVIAALQECPLVGLSFDKATDEYSPKPFFIQDKGDIRLWKSLAAPQFARLDVARAALAAGGIEKVTYSHLVATIKRKKKKAPQNAAAMKEHYKTTGTSLPFVVPSLKEYFQAQSEGDGNEVQKLRDRIASKPGTELRRNMFALRQYLDDFLDTPEVEAAHAADIREDEEKAKAA